MLVASKKSHHKKIPTQSDWFNVMHDIFVMEKLTFALRLKTDLCEKCREGWIEFISPYRTDLI